VLRVPINLAEKVRPWDYLVSVWRPHTSDYELYPIPLRNRLPRIRVPLRPDDADVTLDLQAAFDRAYDSGPYPQRIDYHANVVPALPHDDADWASALTR
jgi:hypothetical protein